MESEGDVPEIIIFLSYSSCYIHEAAVFRLNRMKTTEVADFLNVSQSAISKCLLSREKAAKENNGIIDEILK
jgi:predicted transcriptional regulator